MKATALRFVSSVAKGLAREIACFGARGDGKTWSALWAMIHHAQQHQQHGFPLPTTWLGVRDTFANHRLSTHQSLLEPDWEGRWKLEDGGHIARFVVDGVTLVILRLIGADSPADTERTRTQCHGVWVDEAAAAEGLSNGITDTIWYTAGSSARLPTHANVSMLTSNLPHEDHWAWLRFADWEQKAKGTLCFRIPPGERASKAYRDDLKLMYASRPDLARRLVDGMPGLVQEGVLVAAGFDLDVHVSEQRIGVRQDRPLWIGQDGGHTPASVMAQRLGDEIRIVGAVNSGNAGVEQHVPNLLLPWLGEHAPWFTGGRHYDREWLQVRYDPAFATREQSNIDNSALRTMREKLPGVYHPGPVSWQDRRGPLLALLASRSPRLVIDQGQCKGLIRALSSSWVYTTVQGQVKGENPQPLKNHPHSDLGDALCYLVASMAPFKLERTVPRQQQAHRVFDVYHEHRSDARTGPQRQAITGPRTRW